jgi:hypothetical protein
VSISVAVSSETVLALGVCLINTADGEVEGCEAEAEYRAWRMGSVRGDEEKEGAVAPGRFKPAK